MSLKAKIEAVIYASEDPVTLAQLVGLLGQEGQAELDRLKPRQGALYIASEQVGEENERSASLERQLPAAVTEDLPTNRERERALREYLRATVDDLVREYVTLDRGIEIREVAGGYRLSTKAEYHDAVRGFVKSLKPPLKLTLQALETLAVVAYKQPVTAPEVSEIRGVDSSGVLGSLIARKLITTAGRKQVIGRPILYKTTKDFLLRFGLKDVTELPSISEFEKMAGELAEQEQILMPERSETRESAEERITHDNLQKEAHATSPQADGDSEDLEPDDSNRPGDEGAAVDGRISGLPPGYDQPGDDPSADEAAIQADEEEAS